MKKILISLVVLVVIVVSGWLGASIYVGRSVATIVANLSAKAGQNAAIRMVQPEHKQGLLSSTGQFEIRFNDVAVDAKSGNQMFALQVNYSVENLLLPSSSMRFKWEVKPVGKSGTEFNRLFGSEIKLTGQGKLAYGGKAYPGVVQKRTKARLARTVPDPAKMQRRHTSAGQKPQRIGPTVRQQVPHPPQQ